MSDLLTKIDKVLGRQKLPEAQDFLALLQSGSDLLESDDASIRPLDDEDKRGGIVYLDTEKVSVLLPDIHARMDMVRDVLDLELNLPSGEVRSLLSGLEEGWAQLVCVGDYVHGESRVYDRWVKAEEEYFMDYKHHKAMDKEMMESLGTVEMLMHLKRAFPHQVHLLKGNHENITNESGNGNHPFRKFAQEGPMVLDWMQKFYPRAVLDAFDRLEKNYPLLAIGQDFLVTHAEPLRFYSYEEVLNYRRRPDVVLGLTWTDNNKAEPGSVQRMLTHYLDIVPESPLWENTRHFAGHRVVTGLYQTRADGRFVQFHNPNLRVAAILYPRLPIDLSRDIISF